MQYRKRLGADESRVRGHKARTENQASNGHIMVGVYLSNKGKEVNEAFFKPLEEVSVSQILVLTGDFNFLDISWQGKTVGCKQSRFLEDIMDTFLIQVLEGIIRANAWLDMLSTNKGELVVDVAMVTLAVVTMV